MSTRRYSRQRRYAKSTVPWFDLLKEDRGFRLGYDSLPQTWYSLATSPAAKYGVRNASTEAQEETSHLSNHKVDNGW